VVRAWSRGCTRTFGLEKGGQSGDLVAVFSFLIGRGRENGATLLEMCSDGTRGDGDELHLSLLGSRVKKFTANVCICKDRIPAQVVSLHPWRYSNLP